MAKIKRKGTSGNAKNFITRTQAVRKLQVSLADFRRLCIFKGIYPREPRNKKKANKGSTAPATFYYTKDIQYLLHEPVLEKFRDHKAFSKKLKRALGRNEIDEAQRLEDNRPKYSLDHLVKERYPTFLDAIRDLDDPLNMLFLFANMPATNAVSHRVTKEAEKLTNQWLAYVAKERLIKKVFVSIKGVYYEAQVKGQEVRWLQPFKFPQNIPSDVDFRIMLTFLEFYSTLLHFVLYKLYHDSGLQYPPLLDENYKVGGLSSYILKEKNAMVPKDKVESNEEGTHLSAEEVQKAIAANDVVDDAEEEAEDDNVEEADLDEFSGDAAKGDVLSQPNKYASPTSELFSKFTFYVGREVSLDLLELPILACGGKLVSEIALDELQASNPTAYARLDFGNVTHHITDRPKVPQKVAGRTYVQPQWVFDCINKSQLVPVNQYAPGETLPPHLSPWGDRGIYNPEAEVAEGDAEEEEEEEEEEEVDAEDAEEEEEDEDLAAQRELEMEAAGVKYSEANLDDAKPKKGKKRAAPEDDEKELKKIMMTQKQRKLYNKMQYGLDKKETRQKELSKKKSQLEKKKKELAKLK
ncbi:pescadillo homolog [Diutina catenulata]